MFKLFDNLKKDRFIKKAVNDFKSLLETDFDEIWNIDIKNNMLIALNSWICRKSNYGENIGILSDAERVIYLVMTLESEVNNGGFSQFLYNSSGNFANETASALRSIGADVMAEICDRVLAEFAGEVPKDCDEREAMLDNIFTDEISEVLSQCDSDFYVYPDDLVELCYHFVIKNKAHFTR